MTLTVAIRREKLVNCMLFMLYTTMAMNNRATERTLVTKCRLLTRGTTGNHGGWWWFGGEKLKNFQNLKEAAFNNEL